MPHKLILIDGITGSGKSSTAQYLARQLNLNGLETVWHHEEEENHPLLYEAQDIESMHSQEDAYLFIENYPLLVQTFVKNVQEAATIHIIESYYLQDSIRVLFQNNIPQEEIHRFFERVNEMIAPLDPLVIYLHHHDVPASIRQIWAARGEAWKTWFVDTDSVAPYVRDRALSKEMAAITLWKDYQDFTDKLLVDVTFPVIRIEVGTDWTRVYDFLLDELGLPKQKAYQSFSTQDIAGDYQQEIDDANPRTCRIYLKDGEQYWDGFWREQKLLPLNEQEYVVHSFPIRLVFQKHARIGRSFTIQGTPIYGMVNTCYVRKQL